LQGVSEHEIKKYKVPNAMPLVFEFDEHMNFLNNYALMDLDAHGIKKNN
jgi:bisphosphoglycerate-dependent phosphoglycerate mutase